MSISKELNNQYEYVMIDSHPVKLFSQFINSFIINIDELVI